jgi:hypothetical protein
MIFPQSHHYNNDILTLSVESNYYPPSGVQNEDKGKPLSERELVMRGKSLYVKFVLREIYFTFGAASGHCKQTQGIS